MELPHLSWHQMSKFPDFRGFWKFPKDPKVIPIYVQNSQESGKFPESSHTDHIHKSQSHHHSSVISHLRSAHCAFRTEFGVFPQPQATATQYTPHCYPAIINFSFPEYRCFPKTCTWTFQSQRVKVAKCKWPPLALVGYPIHDPYHANWEKLPPSTRVMTILANRSMQEGVRNVCVLGMRALSSRPLDVDRGLVLRYLDKVKCRSKALESASASRLSTEDASFMRRYRTLQPHVERLDDIIYEMEELRELLKVSRRSHSDVKKVLFLLVERVVVILLLY